MRRCRLPITLLPLLAVSAANGEELQAGVQYQGETRLEVPQVGVSFVLPAGWIGALPQGSDFFLMTTPTQDAFVFAAADEMTLEQARALMAEPIDVGDGVRLTPSSEVETDGSELRADYAVSGSQVPLEGRVVATVGDHGWGVALLGAATAERMEGMRRTMERIIASVTLAAPKESALGATDTAGWTQQLSGRKLSRFYTASGYTEEHYYWLCENGNFYRDMKSGGFGGGASGAFEGRGDGTWRASGGSDQGRLVLSYNDGSATEFVVTIDDSKLYLDGKRHYREATDCR